MLTQLNPSIPVTVTSKDNQAGECIAMIDYGPEHHVLWGVALDSTGEVWWVPNDHVRLCENFSMGRKFLKENPSK